MIIPRDKELLLVYKGNFDHVFYCSKDDGGYDKGDRWQRFAGTHLGKGGVVVILTSEKDYDESYIIDEEELPRIMDGSDPSEFDMEIETVINNIDEWGEY